MFIDSYNCFITLRGDDGIRYNETHRNLSISDFEVLYGNITDEIVSLMLVKVSELEK